jgi:hypothetical protein
MSGLTPHAVDKWLTEQHRLPAVQRWQVRNPALCSAAHHLAAATLRNRLRMGRGLGSRLLSCTARLL